MKKPKSKKVYIRVIRIMGVWEFPSQKNADEFCEAVLDQLPEDGEIQQFQPCKKRRRKK